MSYVCKDDGTTSIIASYIRDKGTDLIIPSMFFKGIPVTSIGRKAFKDHVKLASITIPDSVTSIGDYAFSGCTNLTIYCEASEKPEGWSPSWNYSSCPVVWGYTGD